MSLNREETLLAFCLLITKDLADTCADYDGSIPLPSFCRSDCGHLTCTATTRRASLTGCSVFEGRTLLNGRRHGWTR